MTTKNSAYDKMRADEVEYLKASGWIEEEDDDYWFSPVLNRHGLRQGHAVNVQKQHDRNTAIRALRDQPRTDDPIKTGRWYLYVTPSDLPLCERYVVTEITGIAAYGNRDEDNIRLDGINNGWIWVGRKNIDTQRLFNTKAEAEMWIAQEQAAFYKNAYQLSNEKRAAVTTGNLDDVQTYKGAYEAVLASRVQLETRLATALKDVKIHEDNVQMLTERLLNVQKDAQVQRFAAEAEKRNAESYKNALEGVQKELEAVKNAQPRALKYTQDYVQVLRDELECERKKSQDLDNWLAAAGKAAAELKNALASEKAATRGLEDRLAEAWKSFADEQEAHAKTVTELRASEAYVEVLKRVLDTRATRTREIAADLESLSAKP